MRTKKPFQWSTMILSMSLASSVSYAETLSEVLNKTLTQHPQAVAGLNRYRAEMENVDAAWGGWFPSVDFAAGVGKQQKRYSDDSRPDIQGKNITRKEASLAIKQNLFSGFSTGSSVDQARYKASAEYSRLRNTLQDLALKVIDAYLKVLEHRELTQLAEENLDVHNAIYEQISQRAKQGVARVSDLSQIEGRVARANANVISARNNLMDAESEYQSLVGQLPGDLEQPESYNVKVYETFEKALQTALRNNPELQAAEEDIKASESQYSVVRSSNLPTLDIEVDQSWKHNADGQLGSQYDTTAMLRLRYNLFRGGSDRARLLESAYRAEESRAQRDRMLRTVKESLRLAWAAYEFLGEQKQYLQQHKNASEETVVAYREQFNIGKRTLLDLLDSENELFQSSKGLSSSTYQEIFARYRIVGATGQLLDRMKLILPEDWQQ